MIYSQDVRSYSHKLNTPTAKSIIRVLNLTPKTIECPALPFQGINNIHGSDSLPSCVLSVSHGITNNVLQENLQHSSSFFIDQATDSLNSSSTSQTANCGLCDTLDVIP